MNAEAIGRIIIVVGINILLVGCGQQPAIIKMKEVQGEIAVTPSAKPMQENQAANNEVAVQPEKSFVHVCGAVNEPGVYEVDSDSRVFEAIKQAGGFTSEAHQASVNLADKVVDGQQIVVPTKEEAIRMPNKEMIEANTAKGLVNINVADISKLKELSGIGEAKAKAIVAYREQNGLFNSTEEIKEVSGIGEKLYEKIKENITVD